MITGVGKPADLERVGAGRRANGAMTAQEIAQRLNARRNIDGWMAKCPAHEDRMPSLSIKEGSDGNPKLYCFAGCTLEQITQALGIEVRDLYGHVGVGLLREGKRRREYYIKDSSTARGSTPLNGKTKTTIGRPLNSAHGHPLNNGGSAQHRALLSGSNPPNTSYAPPRKILESWHHSELVSFIDLGGNAQKKLFVLARYLAAIKAKDGKFDFPFATSLIAKDLNVSVERAGKLRTGLVEKGILIETSTYSREKNLSARYRWALRTTLPIPPMPSPEPQDDDGIPF